MVIITHKIEKLGGNHIRMNNVQKSYRQRIEKYENRSKIQSKKINQISNIRIIFFIMAIGLLYYFYTSSFLLLTGLAFLGFIIIFFYLVSLHNKAKGKRRYYDTLKEINEKSLKRLKGQWKNFDDTGKEYVNEDHNFSYDLDLFGKGSLFQWINSAVTYTGRNKLKEMLIIPCKTKDEIYKRQEAVRELADKLDWRQKLAAKGLVTDKTYQPKALIDWAKEVNDFYLRKHIILLINIFPLLTLALIAGYIYLDIPYLIPLIFLSIQALVIWYFRNESAEIFNLAYKYKNNIKAYSGMVETIEKENFRSNYLKSLQKAIKHDKVSASSQINKLEKIVDLMSNRYNMFYVILNLFTLWDFKFRVSLEKWKARCGDKLGIWLDTIGEFEALSSLANIRYDNPTWATPKIIEQKNIFVAEDMGHPLLVEKRVCNDLIIEPPVSILLITGSNMSGKSTLLRTVGINLVLAYSGAPVCAGELKCSIFNIFTSMRVKDNLEENISSFYAELLRIKRVIKACENNDNILFLLDEIFKGTNSADRHTGARVLINKLSNEGAIGLVSTHDFELTDLEQVNPKIKNYHFRERYNNNEIIFDYKLRQGVSTTRNAIYLMKMAGLEIEEIDSLVHKK